MDANTPVICGAGQVTHRGSDILEPMDLMVDAAGRALEDAGGRIGPYIGLIDAVNFVSFSYANPPKTLADRLGLDDVRGEYTSVGGNTPQWLVSRACDAIASGDVDAVLIAGGEALASTLRARKQGVTLDRGDPDADPACPTIGDERPGAGPIEMAASLVPPAHLYPLFESALAARAGRSPDEQRRWLGELLAGFTEVAASHPDLAWFPTPRSPEELSTPTADNRLVGEPYTKLMNAMIRVDQGAALVLASAEAAESAGVPRDRWVFPWAGAECDDVFYPVERPELGRSPAVEAAGRAVLEASGVGVDDVSSFDLYSCFPCAVQMGAEAIGLSPDDSRGLTVTGGLPYFGGPGSNYVTHAIAETVGRCRRDPEAIGLCTGIGWYMTKHAVGLYSGTPPADGWRHPDTSSEAERIEGSAVETVGPEADGTGEVVAMTVIHDRERGPMSAPAVVRLPDGRQTIALHGTDDLPRELSGRSLVGEKVTVRPGSGDDPPRYEPL